MTQETILTQIVSQKRTDLATLKTREPLDTLTNRQSNRIPVANLSGALMGERVRVIAEVKRASPSKGILQPDLDAAAMAGSYARGGAAAISVLTESNYFKGSTEDLTTAKESVRDYKLPVVRKDFIFEPYQVHESSIIGADAILLIVGILSERELTDLIALGNELFLQCLVEVHDEAELQTALVAGAEIIGINNRNLRTFKTSLATTERLAPLIPPGKIIVSESGIKDPETLIQLRKLRVNAVLIGETFVTSSNPEAEVRKFS